MKADFCVKLHTSPKRAASAMRGHGGSGIEQGHSLSERILLPVVPLYGTGSHRFLGQPWKTSMRVGQSTILVEVLSYSSPLRRRTDWEGGWPQW